MRKQRKLIEQDKERKKIQNRIEDTFRRNGDLGASPAEKRDKKFQESKERRDKRNKERGADLVKKSRTEPSKKKPIKNFKSEMQRGLDRLEQIKKQQAADDAAFKKKVEESKKNRGRAGTSPTAGRNIRSKQFIGKKMNMGGVMKNRGGTFKGVF
tara:strand:+ start:85 stop:549 length:465 start_codon:yes stop_codon:yes gene_type:complete